MPWYVVDLNTVTLSSGVCQVSTCEHCNVFKTHLLELSKTVTCIHRHLLFLNDSIGSQLYAAASSKLAV